MSDVEQLAAKVLRLEEALSEVTQVLVDHRILADLTRKRILASLREPVEAIEIASGPSSTTATCARCGAALAADASYIFVKDVGDVCAQCERGPKGVGPYR